jgi:hypothetical protein
MGIIGNVVRYRGRLCLCTSMARQLQVLQRLIFDDSHRDTPGAISLDRRTIRGQKRSVVLDQPLQRLPGEIESVKLGVTSLETGDDAQRLGVVVKAAIGPHHLVKRLLAGMAEGRVAEVVSQCQCLG